MNILLKLSVLALALTFVAASSGVERRGVLDLLKKTGKKIKDAFISVVDYSKIKLKDKDCVLEAAGDLIHLGKEIGGKIDWINESAQSYRAKASDDEQDPWKTVAYYMSGLYSYMGKVARDAVSYNTGLIDAVGSDGRVLFDVFDDTVRYPMGAVWGVQANMRDAREGLEALRDAEPSEADNIEETLTKFTQLKDVIEQVGGKYRKITDCAL